MSGNSRSSCLQTAPIVSDFGRGACGGAGAPAFSMPTWVLMRSSAEGGELVLADLQLVAVLQLVRLDPAPVHVRAVQRAEVVDVDAVAPAHEQRVVARDGHVVEEHLGVRAAPDRHLVAAHEEGLAGAAATRADDERRLRARDLVGIERLELARLAKLPRRGRVVVVLVL